MHKPVQRKSTFLSSGTLIDNIPQKTVHPRLGHKKNHFTRPFHTGRLGRKEELTQSPLDEQFQEFPEFESGRTNSPFAKIMESARGTRRTLDVDTGETTWDLPKGLSGLARNLFIPLAAVGALVFCSFLILNGQVEDIPPLNPGEDTQFQQSMAAYVGLTPTVPAVTSEPIPLDLMESFAWSSYTVRSGDSVSKIAANHALSMDAIIASNGITNARRLYVGQVIRIPNMDGIPYTVKAGDSFTKISAAMGVPLSAILDANDVQSNDIAVGTVLFIPGARMPTNDLKMALGELFIYPIKGRLTSSFGWRDDPISGERRNHAAVDLAAVTGTPIKAAMDGRVATVGYNATYGNYIILTHSGGYQTMYAHMSKTSVRQGVYVDQGTKIGEVGSTGYSTGPHLHFAVYINGRAVNPLEYLN